MAARPVPILYVHHRPELGGAPQSLANLLEALDRDRFEPHVYCPPGPAADLFAGVAEVHTGPVAGFTHIWASTYRGRRWILFARELARLPAHARAFGRLLEARRFKLVHLNDSPLVAAAWLAHRAGIPVVWHLRSALANGGRDRRSRALRWTIRNLSSVSIAISDEVAETFRLGSLVVPNSVDLARFEPGDPGQAKDALGLRRDLPVVTYVGFIYPSKGFEDFIRAASILRRRGDAAQFLIVGGPVRGAEFFETAVGRALAMLDLARDYEADAKRLVERLGLEGSVHFVPFTPDTTVLYQASDVVVAPSRGPELSRPVLEAQACGRPVVASGATGGGRIVLPDETGFLVPRRSPDVLAAVLRELIRNERLRLAVGDSARRHAEVNFDGARNAERVEAAYDQVLS
ncbi:MAG TPA: glycosyltransferase family 4 protein [Candidatus Limnocylindrales bacterium]|nr:glycosyltransferase family 4 protein [Candidatus Limnocylindrales bacterium]